jgi:hypothetical protein
MFDGFSAFMGALTLAGIFLLCMLVHSITEATVINNAVSFGYVKQSGKIYSVRPAATIKVD